MGSRCIHATLKPERKLQGKTDCEVLQAYLSVRYNREKYFLRRRQEAVDGFVLFGFTSKLLILVSFHLLTGISSSAPYLAQITLED
jgi:hypothetical protein